MALKQQSHRGLVRLQEEAYRRSSNVSALHLKRQEERQTQLNAASSPTASAYAMLKQARQARAAAAAAASSKESLEQTDLKSRVGV